MCALSDLEGWRSLANLEVVLFWALEIWEVVHVTLYVGYSSLITVDALQLYQPVGSYIHLRQSITIPPPYKPVCLHFNIKL